jgi:hypothetical protein
VGHDKEVDEGRPRTEDEAGYLETVREEADQAGAKEKEIERNHNRCNF